MLIPLFPLQIVSLPGEKINLHIFEERYKQMTHDCFNQGLAFGICSYEDNKLSEWGTLMQIKEIVRTHPDGEMDIRTIGIQPFQILNFIIQYQEKLYHGAEVELLSLENQSDEGQRREVTDLYYLLHDRMKMAKDSVDITDPMLSYSIAHKVGLSQAQKIELLTIARESERLDYLKTHIIQLMPTVIALEQTREKVKQNGHFKVFPKLNLED